MVLTFLAYAALQQPVSFSAPAGTIYKLLPEISKSIGVPLKAKGLVQYDQLFIRVKDVPGDALLENIAKAARGVWTVDAENVRTLVRDPKVIRDLQKKKSATRIKGLSEYVKRVAAGKSPSFDYDEEGEKKESKPQSRQIILANVISTVGVNNFISLEPGTRVVYSSHPTAMQLPMSFKQEWIVSLLAENQRINLDRQNMLQGAQAEAGADLDEFRKSLDEETAKKYDQLIKDSFKNKKIYSLQDIAKVLVIFENGGNSVIGKIQLLTNEGKDAGSYVDYLGNDEFGTFGFEDETEEGNENEQPSNVQTQVKDDVKLDLDPKKVQEFAQLAQLMKYNNPFLGLMDEESNPETVNTQEVHRKLKELLSNPLESTPDLLLKDYVFQAFAKVDKSNLVIGLNDDSLYFIGNETLTAESIRAFCGLEEGGEGKWVVYAPEYAKENEDLAILSQAIKKFEGKKYLSLDDQAWLALNVEPGEIASCIGSMNGWPGLDMYSLMLNDSTRTFLKIYGTLSDTQKARATQDGIQFSELNQKGKDLLTKALYGAPSLIGNPFSDMSDVMESMFEFDMSKMIDSAFQQMATQDLAYLKEPTEALPNGIPARSLLKMQRTTGSGYAPLEKDSSKGGFVFSMMGLGNSGGMSEQELLSYLILQSMVPELGQDGASGSKGKFIEGEREVCKMSFQPHEKIKTGATLKSFKPGTSDKQYTLADLEAKYEARLKKMKEQMAKFGSVMQFGTSGRQQGQRP